MTLEDRDAYIVDRLAALAAQGITGRQAVNEVIRTAGFGNIALAGHDRSALDDDVVGLQTATVDLAAAPTRATAVANLATVKATQGTAVLPALSASPTRGSKTDAYRMRVVAAKR